MIWAAGIKGAYPSGIDKEHIVRGNRILVDQCSQIKGLKDVFAIGDVAFIESDLYPNGNAMLASVAEQQGSHLAKNLNRLAGGINMKSFRYNDRGTMKLDIKMRDAGYRLRAQYRQYVLSMVAG